MEDHTVSLVEETSFCLDINDSLINSLLPNHNLARGNALLVLCVFTIFDRIEIVEFSPNLLKRTCKLAYLYPVSLTCYCLRSVAGNG